MTIAGISGLSPHDSTSGPLSDTPSRLRQPSIAYGQFELPPLFCTNRLVELLCEICSDDEAGGREQGRPAGRGAVSGVR